MIELSTHHPSGQKVNDDPLIWVFEDFLREDEASALIAAARPQLQRAQVSAAQAGVTSAGRSGSNCWIPHGLNPTIHGLSQRVSALVGLPLAHAESLQVVHYSQAQEYGPHFDAWDASTERGQRCMARGGQRLVTCLLYLNDVEAGGGTSFPRLDLEVRPLARRMVLFHNCHAGSNRRHPASLHGGMPVLAGEKWACNFWFRESLYRTGAKARRVV